MADINQEFFDALVRHQIGLLRVSGSIRNRILGILDKTEADIKDRILGRLATMDPTETTRNLERANVLAGLIKTARANAWAQVTAALVEEMTNVAKTEPDFTAQAIRAVAPVQLDLALPAASTLKALVTSLPFEGHVLRDWAKKIARDDVKRIEAAIKIGMVQGESAQSIAARVVGTAKLAGTDGATEITRTQATGLVRTAVNHFANQARQEFANANSDIFTSEQFVATLDARTTPVCRANDGKTFPTGEGPIPPLHFNCRSLRVPVIDGAALGSRPARPHTERQLVSEFGDENDLDVGATRDSIPHGFKSKFDKFASKRIREMTGQVPAATTYQEWLARQTTGFQNDVLGVTRGKLFRDGGLKLDRFINRRGDELTLHELARRETAAFVKAGLNPDDF
jgi:SPP1 gp7 family putative phage head morphogenesis protein